jgi:hypothetical protein
MFPLWQDHVKERGWQQTVADTLDRAPERRRPQQRPQRPQRPQQRAASTPLSPCIKGTPGKPNMTGTVIAIATEYMIESRIGTKFNLL